MSQFQITPVNGVTPHHPTLNSGEPSTMTPKMLDRAADQSSRLGLSAVIEPGAVRASLDKMSTPAPESPQLAPSAPTQKSRSPTHAR